MTKSFQKGSINWFHWALSWDIVQWFKFQITNMIDGTLLQSFISLFLKHRRSIYQVLKRTLLVDHGKKTFTHLICNMSKYFPSLLFILLSRSNPPYMLLLPKVLWSDIFILFLFNFEEENKIFVEKNSSFFFFFNMQRASFIYSNSTYWTSKKLKSINSFAAGM